MSDPVSERFAILIPDEASLTAPIAAATEMSKMFIAAMSKVNQFQKETWEETITHVAENGDELQRILVHENPRLLEWFKEARRIAESIAKLNSEAETKNIDHKLRLMDMFMTSDSPDLRKLREEFIIDEVKRKQAIDIEPTPTEIVEEFEKENDLPIKNKDYEW